MQDVLLNNGIMIPRLGLGVFQVDDLSICEKAVSDALELGYRLIDTAATYHNESAVGDAVRKSGLPRKDIFITSKIWVQDFGYEKTRNAVQTSLDNLGMDYIDMMLLHQQLSDYYGAWRALQEFNQAGTIRAIGVSNFFPDRLEDLCDNMDIPPAVNQIECHPFFQRPYEIEVMKKLKIAPMAWAPFAEGGHDIWNNTILKEIAKKYDKTVGQVVLRFTIQRGIIVIPKSIHKNRLEENMDVWGFDLDKADMEKIKRLDTGKTEIIDQRNIDTVRFLNGYKIHE